MPKIAKNNYKCKTNVMFVFTKNLVVLVLVLVELIGTTPNTLIAYNYITTRDIRSCLK